MGRPITFHNFPAQPTPFIGRESEVAELTALLERPDCRLLTLVGPGGMGKTRLSIESARGLAASSFEHGVFYVPLAPLTSAGQIVTTMIAVLGIMIGDEGTPQEELVRFLRGRNLLLVMDNFEHLLDGADLVADILNHAPDVKILATSREPLNLRMERVWHVKGMHFPESEQADHVEQYSAIQLFAERATWVRRDFALENQLDCVIQICHSVDGMPLGIELAAGWLKTLSCQDVVKEIERGIDFLSTHMRDIPERHRSIRAVFDHSWHLLTEDEQAVFPRLAVFRGGFTWEAAAKVAAADLRILSGLVEKSMVRQDARGRYDLHELLRQYAQEKLDLAGETEATMLAHVTYFAAFTHQRTLDITGRRQVEGLNAIEEDFDNVVDAWVHAIDRVDYDALDQMMEGLLEYCHIRRHLELAQDLLNLARDRLKPLNLDAVHPVYNRLCVCAVIAWTHKGLTTIPEHIQSQVSESIEIAKQHQDEVTIGYCLYLSGQLLQMPHDIRQTYHQAIDFYEQALTYLHAPYYERHTLIHLAVCYRYLGDAFSDQQYLAKSIELGQRCYRLSADAGDLKGMGDALHQLTEGYRFTNHADPIPYYLSAIAIWDKLGDPFGAGLNRAMLAENYLNSGKISDAIPLFEDAIEISLRINVPAFSIRSTHKLGDAYFVLGDYTKALDLHVQAERIVRDTNMMVDAAVQVILGFGYAACYFGLEDYDKALDYCVTALRFDLNPSMSSWYVLCYPVSALMLWHTGKPLPAAELVGVIFSAPDYETGWLRKWDVFNQMLSDLEAQLGTEVYQSILERSTWRELAEMIPELLTHLTGEEATVPIASQPLSEPLSQRELEVLALLADGLTNPEIAERLYLSTGTVKVHTRNIYGKLNVGNRTEAATMARKLNLI